MNKRIILLTLGLFISSIVQSQVQEYHKYYNEDIEFNILDSNRICIYIFYEKDSSYRETNRLLNFIDELKIKGYDTSAFKITIIKMTHTNVCPPNKIFTLNGYSNLKSSFIYKPYFICVSTNNPHYLKILNNIETKNRSLITKITNKENKKAPFVAFENDIVFRFIFEKRDTFKNEYNSFKSKTNEKINHLYSRAIKDSINYYYTQNYLYLGINSSIKHSNISLNEANATSFKGNAYSIGFERYSKRNNFGFRTAITYNSSNFNIKNSNKLIDSVRYEAYDPNGDKFTKIAYASNISEQISFKHIGISLSVTYRIQFSKLKTGNFILFRTGINLNSMIQSTYKTNSGIISYGGYYPQYNISDTILNGFYEFKQNQQVGIKTQNLHTKPAFTSSYISLESYFTPNRSNLKNKILFGVGLTLIRNSNILEKENKDNKLPDYIENYNSLLYRTDKLILLNLGLNFAICYKL